MKTKVFFCLLFLGVCAMNACSEKEGIEINPDNAVKIGAYTIPIETALNTLDDFLAEQGVLKTRGSVNDYIDNYFVVSATAKIKSLSEQDLIYAVNFIDESGYALLAADSRISEEILAVTDQGSISEEDFYDTNDGLTSTENDDLSVEDYNEMIRTGALANRGYQINQACLDFVDKEINGYGDGGGGGGGTTSGSTTYEWITVKSVPRLMNTLWAQRGEDNLFNKYCPTVGLIWQNKAPAGCVCIAVSQIMAYHEYPSALICNGVEIDYSAIKDIYCYSDLWGTGTEASQEMLARYISTVGAWCNTQYHSIFGKSWGFSWPSDAEECLSMFGYENVSLNMGYDETIVLQSLDDGCPVFMSAIAGIIGGHAWVIDGYIKRNYVSNQGVISKRQTLVHCNWGWHGDCNGYFTSGVFRTQEAEISDGLGQDSEENYWYAFNTITYENPNK